MKMVKYITKETFAEKYYVMLYSTKSGKASRIFHCCVYLDFQTVSTDQLQTVTSRFRSDLDRS